MAQATGWLERNPINGYPDGTFKPDAQVTYAEALAMILRALGYTQDVLKNVVWPVTYVAKAAQLGITTGVTVSANVPATRGDVARLVDNALTVPKVVQVGFGDTAKYVVSGTENTTKVTLLDNLGATYVEGMLVDSPELFTNDGKTVTVGTATLELAEGVKYEGLLGHTVKAWKNAEGKVFLIEDKTPADRVKVATKTSDNKLKVGDTELTVQEAVYAKYFKNRELTNVKPTAATPDNGQVTVILGEDLKTVVAAVWTESTVEVVSSVTNTAAAQRVNAVDLTGKTVTWQGAASSLADVKQGDVIAYYKSSAGDKYVINVVRNVVTGKLNGYTVGGGTSTSAFDAGDKITVTVGATEM